MFCELVAAEEAVIVDVALGEPAVGDLLHLGAGVLLLRSGGRLGQSGAAGERRERDQRELQHGGLLKNPSKCGGSEPSAPSGE